MNDADIDSIFKIYNTLRINFILSLIDEDYGGFDIDKIPNMEFMSYDYKILKNHKTFEEFYNYLINKETGTI